MFCSVVEHVVVALIESVPLPDGTLLVFVHAKAPDDPLVKAEELNATVEAPLGRNRPMVTEGVPASALMLISIKSAVSGTWHKRKFVLAKSAAGNTMEHPPLILRGVGSAACNNPGHKQKTAIRKYLRFFFDINRIAIFIEDRIAVFIDPRHKLQIEGQLPGGFYPRPG